MKVRSSTRRLGPPLLLLAAGAASAQESVAPFDAALVLLRDDFAPFTALLHLGTDPYPDAVCSDTYTTPATNPTNRIRRLYVRPNLGPINLYGWVVNLWEIAEPASSPPEQFVGVGDLDGDGDDDVAFAYSGGVRAFTMNGYTQFSAQAWPLFLLGAPVRALAVGDFEGDARREVAVLAGTTLSILRFTTGIWTKVGQTTVSATGAAFLVTADVDGTGGDDLVLVDDASVSFVPVVAGEPRPASTLSHLAGMPMPAAGDIDGDGDEDFVVFDWTTYEIYRRTSPATFALEVPRTGGPATDLADVDGDGDLDGVCCGGGGPVAPPNAVPSPFRVSLNDGTGVFAPAFEIAGMGAEHLAGATDLDDDGDVDLIAGRCIYYARGTIDGPPAQAQDASWPNGLRFADLDGDGDPDGGAALANVLRNDGTGAFALTPRLMTTPPAGHGYRGPGYPIDVDGDGDEDLVVELWTGSTFVEMRTLRNDAGHFFDAGSAAAPGIRFDPAGVVSAEASLAADIDGDGDRDLVVRSVSGPHQSRIWRNAGGNFSAGAVFPDDTIVHAGDLTNDGIPDLLVSRGDLRLAEGLGGGAFGAPHGLVSAGPPIFVSLSSFDPYRDTLAVADIDPAGVGGPAPDILAVERGGLVVSATVSWDRFVVLRNLAAQANPGSFQNYSSAFGTGNGEISMAIPGPRRVLAADVDRNGTVDALYSPVRYDAGATRTVLREPSGSLLGFPEQMLTAEALADVDGDGDPDAAGEEILLRNNTFFGPAAGLRAQYGHPTPGSAGISPVLGSPGTFRPGVGGELRLRGGLGGAPCFLFFGTVPTTLPLGGGLWALIGDPTLLLSSTLGGAPGTPGAGVFTLPVAPLPPAATGLDLVFHATIPDPGAAAGVAASQGLRLVVGN